MGVNCPEGVTADGLRCYEFKVKNIARVALSTFVISAGLGFVGLGAASMAEAQPGPFQQWCPGEFWDPLWGGNQDGFHCHDQGRDFHRDGDRGGWGHDDHHDDHGGHDDHGHR
jgi:hypothetical protein